MFRKALRGAWCVVLLLGCSRDHRTPLVVYSPHGRDLLTLFEHRFEALHPDIDVRWLDMGSQDVYDRLRSERANPQADVWFGGPSLVLAQAARDSLLDCRRPVWADAIAPRGRGAGDCYFAAYETPAVFLYAEKVVSPAEAPRIGTTCSIPNGKGKSSFAIRSRAVRCGRCSGSSSRAGSSKPAIRRLDLRGCGDWMGRRRSMSRTRRS